MLSVVPPTIHEPARAVFRLPLVALAAVVVLMVCITPFAFAAPWLWLVYLLPAGLAWWVLRLRTEADAGGIRVRHAFNSRRFSWDDVASLRLRGSKWVRAVLHDGTQVTLPNVRTGEVPALALVSGGRLPDPRSDVGAESDTPSSAQSDASGS